MIPDDALIFVSGRKRSGKDWLADVLAARAGFHKYHIIQPWLEEFCKRHHLSLLDYESEKAHWRPTIQAEAAAARREDPDCMVRPLRALLPKLPRPLCVTAVRFANEVRLGHEAGALVLRVACPDDVRRARFAASGESPALFDDPFESEVDGLPVHAEVPGTLTADEVVPLVESIWRGIYS